MYFTESIEMPIVGLPDIQESKLQASHDFSEPLRGALLLAIPVCFSVAAVLASWRVARVCAALTLFMANMALVWLAVGGPLIVHGLRADTLGCLVLLLVTFIGWVITRYSQTCMAGEAGQTRYVRWLMATLAAVSVVVATNNLGVLALAWLATSLSLHQLLTFFSHRPAALIAAHKKFLVSRMGDVCLFAGVALVGMSMGSLEIDLVTARAQALSAYPAALQAAVVLIVISALLKCAQLPVHGWLIQVMEAPTPVSAFLHAGIVNLGGFLLIRLSPLVSEVAVAQTLLVIVGSLTAVLASLVMMTRISVKVMLAWSTCAQMGFMLMQCGLGAYDMALLHLLAHSLYKSHAFLAAGGAVEQARLKAMTAPPMPISLRIWAAGAFSGLVMVAAAGMLWGVAFVRLSPLWVLAPIVSLAATPLITPLLASQGFRRDGLWPLGMALGAFGVAFAYFGLHRVFGGLVDLPGTSSVKKFDLVWLMLCFALLFALQGLIRLRPHGAVARRLYPWFYAGLYLDEWFTRMTFRIWPAKLPRTALPHPTGVFK
jgi:NAD(P)H-quinone oxidoreductase subunit 5